MAICLPGMASRVNRAATSLMRSAPLVMTMNWMMTRIRKMTRPTTRLPPATNSPNVWMIRPASPCRRINRVEATFRDRRNSVVNSSREGNVDSSSASRDESVTMSTAIDSEMLHARSRSSSIVGRGTINVARMATRPIARMMLVYEANGRFRIPSSPARPAGKLAVIARSEAIVIYDL